MLKNSKLEVVLNCTQNTAFLLTEIFAICALEGLNKCGKIVQIATKENSMGNFGFFDVTSYLHVCIEPQRENNSLAYSNYVLKSQRPNESSNL